MEDSWTWGVAGGAAGFGEVSGRGFGTRLCSSDGDFVWYETHMQATQFIDLFFRYITQAWINDLENFYDISHDNNCMSLAVISCFRCLQYELMEYR